MVPSRNSIFVYLRRKLKKPDYLPARIDYYARILMPLGFIIFNIFYWGICFYMSIFYKYTWLFNKVLTKNLKNYK